MPLTSPRFRWNTRLQAVENNSPAMRRNENSHGVRLIQQAMIDLRISPMTKSVLKHGTVDGIFGEETVQAIKKYQRSKSLKDDGVVGQNTMRAIDVQLPRGAQNLPPLPSDSSAGYTVPGAIAIFDQVAGGHPNGCWAYSYTMMVSWKRRMTISPAQAIADLGEPWVTRFNKINRGLARTDTARFYRAARMQIEGMRSIPLSEWGDLLRAHGPMTMHAVTNSLAGGHVRILYGLTGDGTERGTRMKIIDPWNGRKYQEPYEKFLAKYEGGGAQAGRTAQIAHW